MILITRPAPSGQMLCETLSKQGISTLWLPTLDFAPPADPSACKNQLNAAEKYDWMIFISPAAVRHARSLLPTPFPPQCRIAAIGKATARLLESYGFTVSACPASNASADALLQLPEFTHPNDQQIAIVKGTGGRSEPARSLQHKGATVTEIRVYRRVCPPPNTAIHCRAALQNNTITAIHITSASGLIHLFRLIEAPLNATL